MIERANYAVSLTHEYDGFPSSEVITRHNVQHNQSHAQHGKFKEKENEGISRYSAFNAWNGSVAADTDHEFLIVKIGEDSIIREFWINYGRSIPCFTWSS
ncbi:unnamed protein product [Rotaria magnacalcarata]